MSKRLDIHNVENSLISYTIENIKRLNAQLLDTDDYLSNKTLTTIKGVIENKFKRDFKLIKKELKIWNKRYKKDIKKGYINQNEAFDNFLISLGVDVEKYNDKEEYIIEVKRDLETETAPTNDEINEVEEQEEKPEENGDKAQETVEEVKPEEEQKPVSITEAENAITSLLANTQAGLRNDINDKEN